MTTIETPRLLLRPIAQTDLDDLAQIYSAPEVTLMVVYTERGEKTRIISAREATKNERNDYYRENAQGWDGG